MDYLISAVIGYVIGGINPSYIIGKIKGFDIRTEGSGNAGASNAMITIGKAAGIFSALFDVAKAIAVIKLAAFLFPLARWAGETAGVMCIIGHIFPAYMGFRGGKGLACLGGMVLAADYRIFLILLGISALLILITDYLCFVPMFASAAFPVLRFWITGEAVPSLIFIVAAAAILYRHTENIKRIKKGTEAHFSILWNKDEELNRIKELTESDRNKL